MKPSSILVMVTRPGMPGIKLCELIEENGGQTVLFPTIEFLPSENQLHLKEQIKTLNTYDWIIFISPYSVTAVMPLIQQYWQQFPPVNIAAIGEGTKNKLLEYGLTVTAYPENEWNSEGLLKLPHFQNIQNKKIGIVCGETGRELISATMQDRGALVEKLSAYRRILPKKSNARYLELIKNNKIDVVVCTSGEGIKNLKILLIQEWEKLKKIPIVVISERMKLLGQEVGFEKIMLAKNASHDAIIEELMKNFG